MPQVSPNRGQTVLLAAGVFLLWGALHNHHVRFLPGAGWHSGWHEMSADERERFRAEMRQTRDELRQNMHDVRDELRENLRDEFRPSRGRGFIIGGYPSDELRNTLRDQRDQMREERSRLREQRNRIREQIREQIRESVRRHKDWDDDDDWD